MHVFRNILATLTRHVNSKKGKEVLYLVPWISTASISQTRFYKGRQLCCTEVLIYGGKGVDAQKCDQSHECCPTPHKKHESSEINLVFSLYQQEQGSSSG